MLSPDLRATLLDALRPDPGERIDAAVATTFTLDLVAALLPPLAFASFAVRDVTDPITAMEAVRSCNRVVDIFCQAGQIAAPSDAPGLMAFLEPMVHQVRRPRPGRLFHPKIWLLRYNSADSVRLRLLCLTRNITDSNSWDAVLRLDGVPSPRDVPTNEPLAALIRSLPARAVNPLPETRADRIASIADDVSTAEWERPEGVDEVLFHVFGLPGSRAMPNFAGSRHLIVSPFCSDNGIATVTPKSSQRLVVSRPEQLDRLSPDTLASMTPYVLNAAAALSGTDENDDILGGLHAKLYAVERGSRGHLFVGSANATEPAFDGNVEILVELVGPTKHLGLAALLSQNSSLKELLEAYTPAGGLDADPSDEEEWRLEEALRALAESPLVGTVSRLDSGYRISTTSNRVIALPPDMRLSIELLTRPGEARWQANGDVVYAVFDGLALDEVTPFFVLRAVAGDVRRATVVQARLSGDPPGRHDEILARQIDTTEKFLRFLAALLGLTAGPTALLGIPGAALGSGNGWTGSGLFELLVRALADRPEAVADLDSLVERLDTTERGAGVLPDGFATLWRTVMSAHHSLYGKAPQVASLEAAR